MIVRINKIGQGIYEVNDVRIDMNNEGIGDRLSPVECEAFEEFLTTELTNIKIQSTCVTK
jgi:hypothetical protein